MGMGWVNAYKDSRVNLLLLICIISLKWKFEKISMVNTLLKVKEEAKRNVWQILVGHYLT